MPPELESRVTTVGPFVIGHRICAATVRGALLLAGTGALGLLTLFRIL